MTSRLSRTSRLAATLAVSAGLALVAPAAGLAHTQPAHPAPVAHIALGLMNTGSHHTRTHVAATRHRRVVAYAATR